MSKIMDVSALPRFESGSSYDVVVVGAGPYGLSAAAHLLGHGLKVAVFGKPMQLWREHMPEGMLLRSYWWATNLSDPGRKLGLDTFFRVHNTQAFDPLPAKIVIEYGRWFQQCMVPDLDETFVQTIECQEGQYVLTLQDGRIIHSSAVVMAPGLHYYTHQAPEFTHLSSELFSHTSEHRTFERFAGKTVVIVGGGQSALENAALAYESGAHVEVVSRKSIIWIQGEAAFPTHRSLIESVLEPKAGISPGWFNWGLEHFPYAFQRLPRNTKDRILNGIGKIGPMGASWLKPRLIGRVPLHEQQTIQEIKEGDSGLQVRLSNNRMIQADHLILGTGYRIDIARLPMLSPTLLADIQTYRGAPILSSGFESSVPGLYFLGFTSLLSCGPLFRFVVGTEAASRGVTRAVMSRIPQSGKNRW